MGEFHFKRVGGSTGPDWVLALKEYGFTLAPKYSNHPNPERVQKLSYLDNSLIIIDYPECEEFSARRSGEMFEIIAKLHGFHFSCYEHPIVITGAEIGNLFRYRFLFKEDFQNRICAFFSKEPDISQVSYEFDLSQHEVKDFFPFQSYSNLYYFTKKLVDTVSLKGACIDTIATAVLCTTAKLEIPWALELKEIDWTIPLQYSPYESEFQVPPEIEYLSGLRQVKGTLSQLEQLMKRLPASQTLEHIDFYDILEDDLKRITEIKEHFQCSITIESEDFESFFEQCFDPETYDVMLETETINEKLDRWNITLLDETAVLPPEFNHAGLKKELLRGNSIIRKGIFENGVECSLLGFPDLHNPNSKVLCFTSDGGVIALHRRSLTAILSSTVHELLPTSGQTLPNWYEKYSGSGTLFAVDHLRVYFEESHTSNNPKRAKIHSWDQQSVQYQGYLLLFKIAILITWSEY